MRVVKPVIWDIEWRREGKVDVAEFDVRKGRRTLHCIVVFDGVAGEVLVRDRKGVIRHWRYPYMYGFFALQSALAVAERLLIDGERGVTMNYGRVRCLCGRFMKAVSHQKATSCSGGSVEYRCRCGSTAVIWSRHGVDDEPIGGVIRREGVGYRIEWFGNEWRKANS